MKEFFGRSIESIYDYWQKIRDENLKYDINRAVAKISTLWSGKIDKYEYLIGEKNIAPTAT